MNDISTIITLLDLMRTLILRADAIYNEAYDQGYDDGFADGEDDTYSEEDTASDDAFYAAMEKAYAVEIPE